MSLRTSKSYQDFLASERAEQEAQIAPARQGFEATANELGSLQNHVREAERQNLLSIAKALGDKDAERMLTPVVEEPVTTEATPLDVESINMDTREGQRRARKLVEEDYLKRQAAPMCQRFVDDLATRFNFAVTKEVTDAAQRFFSENGLSYLSWENHEKCRRFLVGCRILPITCRTREEQLAAEVENRNTLFDFESRRQLSRQLQDLGPKVIQ